jgi:hypothetical protein
MESGRAHVIVAMVTAALAVALGTSPVLAQGIGGILSGEDEQKPKTPSAETASTRPGPAPARPTGKSTPPSELDRSIDALTVQIEAAGKRKPSGSGEPQPIDRLLERESDYRKTFSDLQRHLFIGSIPEPVASGVERFLARWETLSPRIWAGVRTDASISDADWAGVVAPLRAGRCPIAAAIPDRLEKGVPDGPSWACLSDMYFQSLAKGEILVNEAIERERVRLLEALRGSVDSLVEWKRVSAGRARSTPHDPALRREFEARLERIALAEAIVRRDELMRLRDRVTDTPFERFVALSTAVSRPTAHGARPIAVPQGHMVRVTLGGAEHVVPVALRPHGAHGRGLAQQLHDIHYELKRLDRYFGAQNAQQDAKAEGPSDRLAQRRKTLEARRRQVLERIDAGRGN